MPHKGPHISISPDYVVNRILKINIDHLLHRIHNDAYRKIVYI